MAKLNSPSSSIPALTPAPALPAPQLEAVVGQIETFLQDLITALTPPPLAPTAAATTTAAAARHAGRPRVLPAMCLWAGLLVCLLKGFNSQLSVWRLLSVKGLWHYPRFPITDEAVYKRLQRDGSAPLQALFSCLTTLLAARLKPYLPYLPPLAPFASQVVALDQTSLDQVARTLPALRAVPAGSDRLLPGKLSGLFDLRRQQWRAIQFHADPHQNEKVAARAMLEGLPAGSLVLADLGYFGFEWFDHLSTQHYWWVSRLRERTSYTIIHSYYDEGDTKDQLIWLGAYRSDQAGYAVRLVQLRVRGSLHRYITNVVDPSVLPILDIARLYARRWDIELAFKTLKVHLGLHLLWSAKREVILQQVWGTLILSQIIQALHMEIAARAGVDPFDVSLALLIQYLPQFACDGQDPVAEFVRVGRQARFIRPSRRTVIQAPQVDLAADYRPLPAGLELELRRTPRYALRVKQLNTNLLE